MLSMVRTTMKTIIAVAPAMVREFCVLLPVWRIALL